MIQSYHGAVRSLKVGSARETIVPNSASLRRIIGGFGELYILRTSKALRELISNFMPLIFTVSPASHDEVTNTVGQATNG